ncbi:folylpolyglutamate synthase/dihydrofolate synthase family protein [Alkalibacterium putridalgicola]|uniref:bifunctional folylpolyglutamate synthase/dihydrofolate synthase n=1 Tax=Alkalibacterium putridalgicola TaxID=426703 RepID=UPI0034CF4DCD
MVMDMKDVIALVNTNRGNGKKESLNRMRTLLKKIGNPEQRLSFVHIAGTNGKGSTASFISQILIQANLKTGIFTSPHLEKVNERIRFNEAFISDDDFIRTTEKVAAVVDAVEKECGERLYSFEILTAVALLYYYEQKCDIVVLEAGIGGRLDATNTIPVPEVAIVTSIGMDHTKMLGDTLEKIAGEKAGIIKEKGDVVLPSFTRPIDDVFQKMSEDQQASLHRVDINDAQDLNMTEQGSTFSYKQFDKVTVRMVGKHQVSNALLAIEAALILKGKGYELSGEDIIRGIEASYWPGRMEKIQDDPTIFIDGAHNPEGVERLRESIESLFPDEKLMIVVGMMKDKDYMRMIDNILPYANKVYTVSPDPYRGFAPRVVARQLQEKGIDARPFDSISDTVDFLKKQTDTNKKIIVFGSLYLIGDIKKQWK